MLSISENWRRGRKLKTWVQDGFKYIALCLYVCAWVCGTYIVHYCNGAELSYAPLTCVVHRPPALCTMVHKGDLIFWEVGLAPSTFLGSHGTYRKRTLFCPSYCSFPGGFTLNILNIPPSTCRWCTRVRTRSIVFRWCTRYIQIKVHNVVLYQHTLCWCRM